MNENEYVSSEWLYSNLGLKGSELVHAKKNGLPYTKRGNGHLYRLKDIHDYYSGRIGYDVERKESKNGKKKVS
jgi:hypothetical protein